MKLDLEGKTALVSASSGGIGLEIARSLALEGARVFVNGRTAASVERAIANIKASHPDADCMPLIADNGTAAGCADTIRLLPDVDILVNNLGTYEAVDFFDIADDAWLKIIDTNVMSGVRLSRHYLRGMLDRNDGRIVFVSSESGLNPAPEMAHYSATKTTQLALSRSLAELTKGKRVTVNAVLPGPTRTEGVDKFIAEVFPNESPDKAEALFMSENRPTSLIQRLIEPNEIADVVAFVCSGRGAILNGACIKAEGGIVRSVF